jgi:hypothetical protein
MTVEQQIISNQMETLKEIGEIKRDIGEIKGTIKQVIPRINSLEHNARHFITKSSIKLIILLAAGVFVPIGILAAKLIWG